MGQRPRVHVQTFIAEPSQRMLPEPLRRVWQDIWTRFGLAVPLDERVNWVISAYLGDLATKGVEELK